MDLFRRRPFSAPRLYSNTRQCLSDCDCPEDARYCVHSEKDQTSKCYPQLPPQEYPIYFVHIPKTGGTSFKQEAENLFGKSKMCYDYENLQSKVVNHNSRSDFVALAMTQCSMVAGHREASRYVRDFGLRRTITFVRDPIERYISLYFHHSRSWFNGTIEEFLDRETENQSKMDIDHMLNLDVVPLRAYGFIGLRENHHASLAMINAVYGLELQSATKNVGKYEKVSISAKIQEHTLKDVTHYSNAVHIWKERWLMYQACKPYVHGEVTSIDRGEITGWAWWENSDDAVQLMVFHDFKFVSAVVADKPHFLGEHGAPRAGMVGFNILLPTDFLPFNASSWDDLGDEQVTVVVMVAHTWQVLTHSWITPSLEPSSLQI